MDQTILLEGKKKSKKEEEKATKQCKGLNKPSYYSFTVATAHWRKKVLIGRHYRKKKKKRPVNNEN